MKRIASYLFPIVVCLALLAWGWRIRNPFHDLPGYSDALEVVWGIEWYHTALFAGHVSPLFTHLVFHPNGWHTATLAHTPAIFLLAQPFRSIGGPVFAYNVLVILSCLIAFWGCIRLFRLFIPSVAIVSICAAVFTFMGFRWFRVGGHQNVLWATGLLPWFVYEIEQMKQANAVSDIRKKVILSGLAWGAMISFSLYSVFLGAVAFAIWGRELFTIRSIKRAGATAAIAVVVGAPTMILYAVGSRADAMCSVSGQELISWSANLNSLSIPDWRHPIPAFRHLHDAVYRGPLNESAWANLGVITFVLGLSGIALMIRDRKTRWQSNPSFMAIVGILLALGIVLRWNGEVVPVPALKPLNELLWKAGHHLKPGVFPASAPPAEFETAIPLPGYLLSIFVPFWEASRVASRYAFVGGLGLIALAGIVLQKIPKPYRYLLLAAWLLETLPMPAKGKTLPSAGHPAYQWAAAQRFGPGEGILDMRDNSIMMGPETLFATLYSKTPTASGLGSFLPAHTRSLQEFLAASMQAGSNSQLAFVLREYGVRYIFLHMEGKTDRELWNRFAENHSLRRIQCFEPQGHPVWNYPICVSEVIPDRQFNLLTAEGWSEREPWGMWALGRESQADWYATKSQDYDLTMQAFPANLPGKQQIIALELNGRTVFSYSWNQCETLRTIIRLPRADMRIGRNRIRFRYGFSAAPVEATNGRSSDKRPLSVGFSELRVSQSAVP